MQSLTGALEQVLQLHGVTYEWKDPSGGRTAGTKRGFIAQDVEKIIPEWVSVDDKGFKTLNTGGIDALFVESLRALKAENDALKTRVSALEKGRAPVLSYLLPGGFSGLALGLVPFALIGARRKRGDGDA